MIPGNSLPNIRNGSLVIFKAGGIGSEERALVISRTFGPNPQFQLEICDGSLQIASTEEVVSEIPNPNGTEGLRDTRTLQNWL